MGVTGAGKTTVGRLLASDLGYEFIDADDYHPPANVAKMRAGQALTDDDRWPWLRRLNEILRGRAAAVVACSALKEKPGTPVVVHSISRSGLGFLSQVPLPIGEFVRLYVLAKGWEGRRLDGQTVRCRTHNDCWNEIGVEFTNVETEGNISPQALAG